MSRLHRDLYQDWFSCQNQWLVTLVTFMNMSGNQIWDIWQTHLPYICLYLHNAMFKFKSAHSCSWYSTCLWAGWQRGQDSSPVGARIWTSLYRPNRLWGPSNLLSNGCGGAHSPSRGGGTGRGMKLTTHLQLVPRSRKRGSIHPPHMPSCLVLN
jgi:hypothetical protein